MRTLFLLFTLVFSSFWGASPDRDALLMPSNATGGESCIQDTFEGAFPHVLDDGRQSIECITIENVTATFSNSSPVQVELRVSGQSWKEMDDWGYQIQINQWRDGNELFVSIYREVVPVSQTTPNLYEETVPLRDRLAAGTYTVHVNDYTFEIAVPDAPPPGSDAPPPYDGHHGPGGRLERHYAVVQNVDVNIRPSVPARVALHVTGYFDDGCAAPLQIDQRREGRWVFVEIYRLVDPGIRCRMVPTPLDEYIRLDGSFERGTYIIQVNDYVQEVSIPYPPPPPPPPDERSYAVIENVEVLLTETFAYPPGLMLHVTGYYSQGCQGALHIDQRRQGNWVYVEIYQLVNPMIMCPEMMARLDEYIRLDGGFEYGTYSIQVNDYQFWYTLGPVYDTPKPK
jgi:hypothetical protein